MTSRTFWRVLMATFIVPAAALFVAWLQLFTSIMKCPPKPAPPLNIVPFKYHGVYFYITEQQSRSHLWFSTHMAPMLAVLVGLAVLCHVLCNRYAD
ncbi:hypothetical protein [Dyella japonica]|uniref:hypothetical protein n=1 Tax=Dyella japonica TaxID=231455 RepID=UPI001186DE17|nr:hypothetical protein [Dyella japonica]